MNNAFSIWQKWQKELQEERRAIRKANYQLAKAFKARQPIN